MNLSLLLLLTRFNKRKTVFNRRLIQGIKILIGVSTSIICKKKFFYIIKQKIKIILPSLNNTHLNHF